MTITESGMIFGNFPDNDVCNIERTSFYESFLSNGVKTVEFILIRNRNDKGKYIFVEAKTTFPNPETPASFDEGINEIALKFIHTIELIAAVLTGIHDDREEELGIFQGGLKSRKIELTLVIANHKDEWLPPVSDALKRQLKAHKKIWKADIRVMHKQDAINNRLVIKDLELEKGEFDNEQA